MSYSSQPGLKYEEEEGEPHYEQYQGQNHQQADEESDSRSVDPPADIFFYINCYCLFCC